MPEEIINLIAVAAANPQCQQPADALAKKLNLPCDEIISQRYPYLLVVTEDHIELRATRININPIFVNFISGKIGHRVQYGGGLGQLIARAVGLRGQTSLTVLDATAGLGQDAFILANLGCDVVMLERSPIISVLLEDGLKRAKKYDWVKSLKIKLIQAEAKQYLGQLKPAQYPAVIYLDPMFPAMKKSALVKKEMRVLRDIVGEDLDAEELLKLSLQHALKRVVVKRARYAAAIPGPTPDIIFKGKSSRFDVYLVN